MRCRRYARTRRAKRRQVAAGFVEPASANRVTLADGRTAAPGRPKGGRFRVRHSQASASAMGGRNATQHRTPVAWHRRHSRPRQHRHRLRATANRTVDFRNLYPAPVARGDRTGGTGDRELCDVRHARSGRSKLLRMRPLLPPHGISPADPWLPRTAPRHRRRIRIRLSAS